MIVLLLATVILPALILPSSAEDFQFKNVTEVAPAFECTKEGRFEDREDCISYYVCLWDEKIKKWNLHREHCLYGGFHPKKQKCVNLKELPGCSQRKGRSNNQRPDLDHLCKDIKGFVCENCKSLVLCVDNKAYASKCQDKHYCTERSQSFNKYVCHKAGKDKCGCKEAGFRIDPFHKNYFIDCAKEDAEPAVHKCPSGYVFNEEKEYCTNKLGQPPCHKSGKFPSSEDCTSYYHCVQKNDGWVQKQYNCTDKELFSDITGKCEDPCKWGNDAKFDCKKEGRFADELDCRRYYECTTEEGSTVYDSYSRICPFGSHWVANSEGSDGTCEPDKMSPCKAQKFPKCKIPDNYCDSDTNGEEEESGDNDDDDESTNNEESTPNEEESTDENHEEDDGENEEEDEMNDEENEMNDGEDEMNEEDDEMNKEEDESDTESEDIANAAADSIDITIDLPEYPEEEEEGDILYPNEIEDVIADIEGATGNGGADENERSANDANVRRDDSDPLSIIRKYLQTQ